MTFTFQEEEYAFPDSLSELTLQQRIDYDNLYGKELTKIKKAIDKMKAGSDKDVESFIWLADCACKAFSFFAGIDLEIVRTFMECRQAINVYYASLEKLLIEEMEITVQDDYLFNGDTWVISPPIESDEEDITFSQFQMIKQIALDLVSFGEGDWSKLIDLCVLFFRKSEESFEDVAHFTFDHDARKELFKSLPLDIAMTVGIYLKDTMILYLMSLQEKPIE